ncbi:FAD-dependent oxidoreductase [Microbacterium sp. KUDC0406]|uniref:FAD-dependent oxidoreductase n=1 Tax=Microbacterium sp. KUDC0406 TaxID=2909588 RepID=UPI001F2D0ED5|nr:FAD-dependent oxidoreductase [Microbacterium sp. KUDC0406]UJP09601.1 FAD-dependent oxidoreductase [Microbacterium sp. KUDC0406]
MSTRTYTRTITSEEPTDVLVVGSGPAGLAAAVAAARSGVSVRMIERFGFLGGNLTAGLVGPCMTSFSLDGETQLVRGVFDEFVRRMESIGAAVHPSHTKGGTPYAGFIRFGHDAVTPFEPEAAKRVAQEMVLEAGVDLLLHTWAVDAVVEDGAVRGVVVANKSGMSFLPAEVVIDATGDGDIAALAGAEFTKGRESDGLMQPMTLFFRIGGVHDAEVERYRGEHPDELFPFQGIVERAQASGRYVLPRRGVQLFKTLEPGVWRINTTRVLGLDGTDARDLTRGEIEARRQVDVLMDFFHRELPGLQDCTLIDTAATVGVRETRRIAGEYELTLDDLVAGRHFDDVIAVAGYPVDIHSPSSTQGPFDDGIPPTANAYEIPYRSLVPLQVDGLLVTGRCISATHEALAAVRVMPPSFAMGEAAGVAAAFAVGAGAPVRDADVGLVQRELVSRGAYLGAPADAVPATP